MMSLDTHQFCVSAGSLQVAQGEHHFVLKVRSVTMADVYAAAA